MTVTELREKLEAEVKRAEAYRNPYAGTAVDVLGASPEYIRGGNAALKGVIALLKEMEGSK